jgi:hypothetical protein
MGLVVRALLKPLRLKRRDLVLIDPALSDTTPHGHHWSSYRELRQITREHFVPLRVYGSASNCHNQKDIQPHFDAGTYLSAPDIIRWSRERSNITANYHRMIIPRDAVVLMPTASPWHLEGLISLLEQRPDLAVSIGLILPPQFWGIDPYISRLIDYTMSQSIKALMDRGAYIYTETGDYTIGSRHFDFPQLLQPISNQTQRYISNIRFSTNSVLTYGFFGSPKNTKGFKLIVDAVKALNPQSRRVKFFVPTTQDCGHTLASSDALASCDAAVRRTTNEEMLSDMASVDVVLCVYDPLVYNSQMSGIVSEALLLGKPLIITNGTSLERFCNQVAPGAAMTINYSTEDLVAALQAPTGTWEILARRAEAAANAVSAMKSGARFLNAIYHRWH